MLLFLLALPFFAEDATFFQKIEWKSNANALEYKVEIQNTAGGKSQFITTDKTSTEISLVPGKYRYRVYAYDFLGKEASVSSWTNFEVFKASKPKITSVEKSVTVPSDSDSLSISVNIADINANSTYELVNESLVGSVDARTKAQLDTGSETDSVNKLNFKNVPPGKWRLKVTNASGLSSLSDVIEIKGEEVKTISDDELKKIRDEAAESATLAAEKKFDEERKSFEEERKRFEEERAKFEEERKVLDKKFAEAEAKRAAEEAKKKAEADARAAKAEADRLAREKKEAEAREKAEWKAAHPYIYKDVIFELGFGLSNTPYDGTIKKYTDTSLAAALLARITFLPIKTEKNKFGVQLGFATQDFEGSDYLDAYYIDLDFSIFDLDIVWQHKLSKKTFFSLKGGLGLANVEKKVSYHFESSVRAEPVEQDFWYPAFTLGASLFFTPWKCFVLELGVDYNHVMATGMTTGIIRPYACVGFRF